MEPAGVDGSCQKVVGSRDGMQIAGEVQVEVLHRDDLAVSASGGSAFDAECGALAGLADAREDAFSKMRAHRLAEPDGGCGLAFAQWGGCDGSHQNVLAVLNILEAVKHIQADLGLVLPVELKLIRLKAKLVGHFTDGLEFGSLGDLDVRRHGIQRVDGGGTKGVCDVFLHESDLRHAVAGPRLGPWSGAHIW